MVMTLRLYMTLTITRGRNHADAPVAFTPAPVQAGATLHRPRGSVPALIYVACSEMAMRPSAYGRQGSEG